MKILAVDDDPIFLGVLRPMLGALGKDDVTIARSGHEAMFKLVEAEEAFDCLLLDIQMPGMSGVQLCSNVRNLPDYRRTPIVMITAMTGKRFIDDAFTAGATDYITKPLDPIDLKARIGMAERLLKERSLTASLEKKFDQRSDIIAIEVDFDTPFPIPGFERGVEYLALENYLLMLGGKRMYSTAAFGISVSNAHAFFKESSPSGFVNMLGDVASAISDAVKSEQMMIAYAGAGNFVAVLSQAMSTDRSELEAKIQSGLEDFASFYAADRQPVPQIKIGDLARTSFFGLFNPTSILDHAVTLAQSRPDVKTKAWWTAA